MKWLTPGFTFVLAVGAAAALALTTGETRPAFACTGPPTHWQIANSPIVIAGRIVSAEEDSSAADPNYRVFRLQIDVERAFRGADAGQRIAVTARVPGAGPIMCPQFDRDETFLGKFLVAGLGVSDTDGTVLGRWPTAYIGFDPGSDEYLDALRVARMTTGGGPDLPQLIVEVPGGRCEALVTLRGARFEPGQTLLLNHPLTAPQSGEFVRPTVVVSAGGTFAYSFHLPSDWCPMDWFVEAYADEYEGQIGGWPLAVAPLRASKGIAPLPPDVGNSPPHGSRLPAQTAALTAMCCTALAAAVTLRFRSANP